MNNTEPAYEIERDAEGLPVRMWWRDIILGSWRATLAPIVAGVIRTTQHLGEKEMRKLLRRAWDDAGLGPRKYHPYKIWCDEINRQLGLTQPPQYKPSSRDPVPPEQGKLFE